MMLSDELPTLHDILRIEDSTLIVVRAMMLYFRVLPLACNLESLLSCSIDSVLALKTPVRGQEVRSENLSDRIAQSEKHEFRRQKQESQEL